MDAPQPPGGYGAWPPPPYAPQPLPPPPASGLSVGAFLCAVFLVFPAALAMGIVSLSRPAGGQSPRGRRLAIAAVALAAAEVVALSAVVSVAALRSEDRESVTRAEAAAGERPSDSLPDGAGDGGSGDGGDDENGDAGEEISVYSIRVGDCFDTGSGLEEYGDDGEDGATEEFSVTRLPCGTPHEAEAFGTVRVTGYDSFPGDETLSTFAYEECARLVQPYVVDTWTLGTGTQILFYYPQESSWRLGDRDVLCFFAGTADDPLRAPLRGDPAELSAEQLRYLEVTTPLEVLVWNEPLPEAELAEHQAWAAEMADAVAQEAQALREESWSASVSGLVDDLVAARESSRTHWSQAAEARNTTEYDGHYAQGWSTLGFTEEIAIREALGLSTGE